MSYSRPNAQYVRDKTGLEEGVEALTSTQFDDLLNNTHIPSGEAKVAGRVGPARFNEIMADDTYGQLLVDAVALRAASSFMKRPGGQVATGRNVPRPMDGRQIMESIQEWSDEARQLEDLCAGGLRAIRARSRAYS